MRERQLVPQHRIQQRELHAHVRAPTLCLLAEGEQGDDPAPTRPRHRIHSRVRRAVLGDGVEGVDDTVRPRNLKDLRHYVWIPVVEEMVRAERLKFWKGSGGGGDEGREPRELGELDSVVADGGGAAPDEDLFVEGRATSERLRKVEPDVQRLGGGEVGDLGRWIRTTIQYSELMTRCVPETMQPPRMSCRLGL